MIPVAMLLLGVPAGRFCRTTRQALATLLAVFATILVVQTIIVTNASNDGVPLTYWLVQIASLAGGLLLLWVGIALRRRSPRRSPTSSHAEGQPSS